MANIANVKVKSGNVLELSGSSVSISGSTNVGGNLVVEGNITANRLDIVETTVSASILYESGSTKFGNDSGDTHQFSGSILASGSMTIAAGSGQYNGSGAGLTDIPNGALTNSAITINGASTSLGGSITTVGAGNGLAEAAPVSGEIVLSVQLSGSDSGLVVDAGGVKLSGSVARLDRDANFGTNNVTASTFVGALQGTASAVANTATFTSSAGDASGITFDGSAARTVGYQTLGAATTGSENTFSGIQTFSTALSASQMTGSTALVGTLTLTNDLAVAHGGTGLSTTPTNGQLLIGNGTGYTLATLTTGSDKVTITNGAGSISIDIDPDAVAGDFVNKSGEQTDITGAKTFDKITVSGSGGLTLTSAAPLVASGSVEVQGTTTLNGATIVGKSLDLDGILTVAAAATGSVSNDHSVVMAADNSEVVLQAAATGRVVIVKKVDAGTSAKGVEIQASGSQTIDGAGTYGLYGPFQSVTLIGSGSSWFVL
jgi:hypothetical protein